MTSPVSAMFAVTIVLTPVPIASLILDRAAGSTVIAAAALLPFAACVLLLESVQSVLSGMQDAKGPLVIAVIGAWCLGLPLGAPLAWFGEVPAQGLWTGLVLGGAVTTALYAVRLRSRLSGARSPTGSETPRPAGEGEADVIAPRRR